MKKYKIKKDDVVLVISGKDKGKKGKVLKVMAKEGKVLVEGVNLAKKHMRRISEDMPSGIVEKEMPMDISNVMFLCQSCNRPVRLKINISKDGEKSRVCKKCSAAV